MYVRAVSAVPCWNCALRLLAPELIRLNQRTLRQDGYHGWLQRVHVLSIRTGGFLDVGRLRIDGVGLLKIEAISGCSFLVKSVVVSTYA